MQTPMRAPVQVRNARAFAAPAFAAPTFAAPPFATRGLGIDAVSAVSLGVLLTALVFVLATAISSPLKDDVAWLLYVARRWLAGERLYEDLVEVNPPLIVWIYAVPARLSAWLGVSPKTVSEPFFAAILLGCGWWTASLLGGRAGLFERRLPAFAAIGCVLLLLPGIEFGQREHLLAAAALPYLALFARELAGEAEPRREAALAGVLAGLGCALKPSYLLAYLILDWSAGGAAAAPGAPRRSPVWPRSASTGSGWRSSAPPSWKTPCRWRSPSTAAPTRRAGRSCCRAGCCSAEWRWWRCSPRACAPPCRGAGRSAAPC